MYLLPLIPHHSCYSLSSLLFSQLQCLQKLYTHNSGANGKTLIFRTCNKRLRHKECVACTFISLMQASTSSCLWFITLALQTVKLLSLTDFILFFNFMTSRLIKKNQKSVKPKYNSLSQKWCIVFCFRLMSKCAAFIAL